MMCKEGTVLPLPKDERFHDFLGHVLAIPQVFLLQCVIDVISFALPTCSTAFRTETKTTYQKTVQKHSHTLVKQSVHKILLAQVSSLSCSVLNRTDLPNPGLS